MRGWYYIFLFDQILSICRQEFLLASRLGLVGSVPLPAPPIPFFAQYSSALACPSSRISFVLHGRLTYTIRTVSQFSLRFHIRPTRKPISNAIMASRILVPSVRAFRQSTITPLHASRKFQSSSRLLDTAVAGAAPIRRPIGSFRSG